MADTPVVKPLPHKVSPPRCVMTPLGAAMIDGPFADDYTKLKWQYAEYSWGETAQFQVAGLEAFVQDCDGDRSIWHLKDLRTGAVIAKGDEHDFSPPHFFVCLYRAEVALRSIVELRIARLKWQAVI